MDKNLKIAFDELNESFTKLSLKKQRMEIVNKINEISSVFNALSPTPDIVDTTLAYTSETEYLCYLNSIIYNLENKIGNIFK